MIMLSLITKVKLEIMAYEAMFATVVDSIEKIIICNLPYFSRGGT
jgi:hypothetical protein